MIARTYDSSSVLVARSRRTGERYPVRMSHLAAADERRATESGCAVHLHYLSKDKSIVCRCNRHSHRSQPHVQHPEIQDLCTRFFQMHLKEATCSREQWRSLDTTSELGRTSIRPKACESRSVNSRASSRSDPFGFDTPSVVEMLAVRARLSLNAGKVGPKSASTPRRSHQRPLSLDTKDKSGFNNGTFGEDDIPEAVWRVSRPSVFLGQCNSESRMSTPLGSSVTPIQNDTPIEPRTQKRKESILDSGVGPSRPVLPRDDWYELGHSPGPSVSDDPLVEEYQHATQSLVLSSSDPSTIHDIVGLQPSMRDPPRRAIPGSASPAAHLEHVVELPSSKTAIELDAIPLRLPKHHSFTLRELEGSNIKHISELDGRGIIDPPKKTPSRRLTRLADQSLWDVDLPCQGDFFSTQNKADIGARLKHAGACSLCQKSFDTTNTPANKLACGHFIHQECLMARFRLTDLEFGNCPVCGLALCKRTLHDRIEMDRKAIFGESFTKLRAAERIEFSSYGESIICWSEEEVASVQLRLLKDRVDYHADELHAHWRQTYIEPDWFHCVVAPVIQLFKGWNRPTRKCTYFGDRDAFYSLVIWAELVRLMNTICERVQSMDDEGMRLPPLDQLYRRFMLAKKLYETEKKSWTPDRFGVLQCDQIAKDAFSMAIGTCVSRPE